MGPDIVHDLGGYLREQRVAARLSLRQLSRLAGISNPYLSQIERGLKKPSAEILQQIARGLQVSAESLYVKAGILEQESARADAPGVLEAITADPRLTDRQRAVLREVYTSFVGASPQLATDAAPLTADAEPGNPAGARAEPSDSSGARAELLAPIRPTEDDEPSHHGAPASTASSDPKEKS